MTRKARQELSFRRPMAVTEVVYLSRIGDSFSLCPRCRLTMDREYMHFCDRCGQRLDWTNFGKTAKIFLK